MSIRNILRLSGNLIRQRNITVSGIHLKALKTILYSVPIHEFSNFRSQFRLFRQDRRVTELQSNLAALTSIPKLKLCQTHQSGSMSKTCWAPARFLGRQLKPATLQDGRHRILRNSRRCRTLLHEPRTLCCPFILKSPTEALGDVR